MAGLYSEATKLEEDAQLCPITGCRADTTIPAATGQSEKNPRSLEIQQEDKQARDEISRANTFLGKPGTP